MNEFDYDCYIKKKIAQQERHRKKSTRKCTLPSEKLTKKQWKERCSTIMTINLNKPTNWSDFKKLSVQAQKTYITHLMDTYGVNATALSLMFDRHLSYVCKHMKNIGVEFKRGKASSMTDEQMYAWHVFLGATLPDNIVDESYEGETSAEQENESSPAETAPVEAVHSSECEADCAPEEIEHTRACGMNTTCLDVQFDGEIEIDEVARWLKRILAPQARGKLRVTFEAQYECDGI